jgi:hypothetical protein
MQASPFLFASSDRRVPSSARKVHLRRLCDILHLSIQRGDLLLARSAFGLLARCEDVEWAAIWKLGLVILAAADGDPPSQPPPPGDNVLGTLKHIEFLRVMMLRHPEEVRPPLGGLFSSSVSLLTHHPSPFPRTTARNARARVGVITGDGWTGARRPR